LFATKFSFFLVKQRFIETKRYSYGNTDAIAVIVPYFSGLSNPERRFGRGHCEFEVFYTSDEHEGQFQY